MATTENGQRDEMVRHNEHLWLADLRKNPGGEVRLFSAENKLISGTYAFQVTRSIDAMVRAAAKLRTITTAGELDAMPEGSVVMGFDKWDRDPVVSTKQYGEWQQAGTDDGWQANGLIDNYGDLTVLHEPEAEVGS